MLVADVKLAYYDHTTRKQGSCLNKEIMQGTMLGVRRRGRPRTAWMDNIKKWTGLSAEDSVRMTEDTEINGESASMVWPTLGSRTAEEQNRCAEHVLHLPVQSISRAFVNGSVSEHVVDCGLESPEAVVVDWVAHNLYWVDAGTRRVEMSHVDGSSRRVIVWRNVQPRSLAVDPAHGSVLVCFIIATVKGKGSP